MGRTRGRGGGSTRLVIAPHLDDAVLSCFRALFPAAGARATVLTVFAAAPAPGTEVSAWDQQAGATDAHAHGLLRQEEDRRALGLCNVPYLHLDFVGGQYGADEQPWRPLFNAVRAVAQGFEEVWLPAAIGGHRDHLLLARLGSRAARGKRRVLYADMPYCLHTDWRTLIAAADGQADGDEWRSEQRRISPFLPWTRPRIARLSVVEQRRKREALECYATQLPGLVTDVGPWLDEPGRFGWELSWDYGGRVGWAHARIDRLVHGVDVDG